MTDRELLELAAKVADITIGKWSEYWQAFEVIGAGSLPKWNPLNHNGDALRLAVDCCLPLNIEDEQTIVGPLEIEEKHGANPYAATRRAIVRAAAEIARRAQA